MTGFERIIYFILTTLGLYTFLRYLIWWFKPDHFPSNWENTSLTILDGLIFLVLTYVVFFGLFLKIGTWFTIWFIKRPHPLPAIPNKFKVAFITCYVPGKEPLSMLEKTLLAMKNAEYAHDTWVLDEGNDPKVKKLCHELKIYHFTRKNNPKYNQSKGIFRAKTKAGNLNSWRKEYEHNYDIVAQVDMDHKPHADYLTKQIGYFLDSRVGYVVTPQIYKNTKNWIAKAASEQTHFFYGPLQQGLYGSHMPFLIGTTHIYRVKAMKEIGGYAPTIAEDYLTSMYFSSNHWKGIYHPEILAQGLGPTNWTDYYNQQMRWSYGLYEILFKHSHHHFPRITTLQKINLFFSQMFYFSGLATFTGFILTTLYLIFGINSANIHFLEWCIYALPAYFSSIITYIFLHRYYINPSKEPAISILGGFLSIAAGIIYAVAFINFIMRKKLTYKITSKTKSSHDISHLNSLTAHIYILLIAIIAVVISFISKHDSTIIRFWEVLNIVLIILLILGSSKDSILNFLRNLKNYFKFFELSASKISPLPKPVTVKEKYSYMSSEKYFLLIPSIISFIPIQIAMFNFINNNLLLWPLLGFFILTNIYFFVTLAIYLFSKDFDVLSHLKLRQKYHNKCKSTVDVFLPNAGESIEVLKNTWDGVISMKKNYKGKVTIYCLDDFQSREVQKLAALYNFKYIVRPNKGWYKKAGNLRYGFQNSNSEFIAIFDADFRPDKNFLNELMPYFYEDSKLAIVQSPQFFDVTQTQNWLQRGAGAIQELFYRLTQVARQTYGASICVGSNAIYRRSALSKIGGTALAEHSEDVLTGISLQIIGWKIKYIPINLAKGLCPPDLKAFFKQQYRWCCGSITLFLSPNFWNSNLSIMLRLSFLSGVLHYLQTALSAIIIPFIPILIILLYPDQVIFINTILLLPSIIFVQIIYPLYHKATFGPEAWAAKLIYSWAHLFAIIDIITEKIKPWQPTGTKINTDYSYIIFRIAQILLNLVPSIIWIVLSANYILIKHNINFLPLLISGIYFFLLSLKISLFDFKPSSLKIFKTSSIRPLNLTINNLVILTLLSTSIINLLI